MRSSTPSQRTEDGPDLLGRGLIRDRDDGRQELADLADQQFLIGAGDGQADDLESLGIATHDVQRLGADRPRRTEDGDAPHGQQTTPDRKATSGGPPRS